MRSLVAFAVFVVGAVAPPSLAASPQDDASPPMACDVGPLQKTFGGTDWVVYSCSDRRTVVIHSAAGNPAMPFYFMFFQQDGNLRLYGEGTGDKTHTEAAFKELEPMTAQDVAGLIQETMAAKSTVDGQ